MKKNTQKQLNLKKQHLINMMKADEELGLYEEPKQETTLEEVAEYLGFVKGVKWQQERSYSEEDMKKAFKVGFSIGYGSDTYATEEKDKTCEEWFERIKK